MRKPINRMYESELEDSDNYVRDTVSYLRKNVS